MPKWSSSGTSPKRISSARRSATVVPSRSNAATRSAWGVPACSSNRAANFLSAHGRVAILDLDYHHGNGQQDIFYARDDVLTISIHGNPRFAYPYFSGRTEEQGIRLALPLNDGEQAVVVTARLLPRLDDGDLFLQLDRLWIGRMGLPGDQSLTFTASTSTAPVA